MSPAKFDPFQDRLARDIRNELSSKFMESLQYNSMQPVQQAAEGFLNQGVEPLYQHYINDRMLRYKHALTAIAGQRAEDVLKQGLVLWDQELFFEVHELLEHAWLSAIGSRKKMLQAFIRAAGVFVHVDHGNMKGAASMAAKAIHAFEELHEEVPDFVNTAVLLECLRHFELGPKRLWND